MEYTFRTAFSDPPCTIRLHDHALSCEIDQRETIIPYANIELVQLIKIGDQNYKTVITTNYKRNITITNKFYNSDNLYEDRSRAYATFIRVLHYHLKDKSRAVFTSGKRLARVWFWLACAVFVSFVISYFTHYLGLGLANPVVQGVALTLLMAVFIVGIHMSSWQRHYPPTDIPLDFLP